MSNMASQAYQREILKRGEFSNNSSNQKSMLPSGAKTKIDKSSEQGIRFIVDSSFGELPTMFIIPHIFDIKVHANKVVEVEFADGTYEKAVLDEHDNFSLEQGISVCITKRILSGKTFNNGGSVYNKLIDYALKVYRDNRNTEEITREKIEQEKAQIKRIEEKNRRKRIKRANKNREREIEIQKEAYLRAMKELNGTSDVNN